MTNHYQADACTDTMPTTDPNQDPVSTPPPTGQELLDRAREGVHEHCVACGSASYGVGLRFMALDDGSVQAVFPGGRAYQGYSRFLHGGIIATFLDAAMTNCLFAQDRIAVTAELQVQYLRPVVAESESVIRAWTERKWGPLFLMRSELLQGGQVHVTATAKFMETVSPTGPRSSPSPTGVLSFPTLTRRNGRRP